jgi:hypothetical protein
MGVRDGGDLESAVLIELMRCATGPKVQRG